VKNATLLIDSLSLDFSCLVTFGCGFLFRF